MTLPRYTELCRSGPLESRTELKRAAVRRPAVPKQGGPSPRSQRRTATERRTKEIVRVRSGGRCERCGQPATNASHRKPVSQGGKWTPENILDVCGHGNLTGCHAWVHEDRNGVASRMGWSLKSWQDPATEPVTFPDGVRYLLDDEGGRRPA